MECYSGCSESGCVVELTPESRRFFTNEEKIKMLNDYKDLLEREANGVSEKIKELEKDK